MRSEQELVAEYRRAHPRSRAIGIIRYIRNGGRTRQRGCVLCGARGPTWCGLWPKTAVAKRWESEHRAMHLAEG
jgi:hypothetical protein